MGQWDKGDGSPCPTVHLYKGECVMKELEIESKFRIKIHGEKVFGEGPCILLEKIDKLGSLSKACEDLNMSYSKGWSIINNAEALLNVKLIETKIGGADGGGSYLTEDGKKLIRAYRDFTLEAEKNIGEIFKKHFDKI